MVLQFGRRESMACGSLGGWASLRWPGSWGIECVLSLAFSRQETGVCVDRGNIRQKQTFNIRPCLY